jgi:hypothetical protein
MSRRGRSGVVHYKDESEFNQAQKKAGGKPQGQSVKTYYKPSKPSANTKDVNEGEREGLKHHAERVASNRKQRDNARKNRPLKEKVHDALGRVGTKVKGAVGPALGSAVENINKGRSGVTGAVEGFHIAPPATGFTMPNINPMTMGMGSMGIAGPPSWMMGGMMGEPEPERRAPRRRNRRRAPAQHREPAGPSWEHLGGVPDSVKRWM